ncbi:Indole-3-glycerol phosphate synthase [hydrothermal vent metagenome]|uniref:indole-3-glycerol-phosphate synthase n=1 Tax=hydrothermal vent metagenome TaxID=652676 RepID=A0A3B0UWR6_9ZZZZ
MLDVLSRIIKYKKDEISQAKSIHSWEDVVAKAHDAPPARGFLSALKEKRAQNKFGLIAEVKKASPSKGLIREDFDPIKIAKAYEKAGAACLSVLTDEPSFQGSPIFMQQAREATNLPVLRKDFMLETYQVVEARSWGADCILIIMAAVEDDTARFLLDAATEWKMDALIEVHNEKELERALLLNGQMIGINNRNLRTFDTSLETSVELAKNLPSDKLVISESGISSHEQLQMLKSRADISTVLVGESLMRNDDVQKATQRLLGFDNSSGEQ